ncbi:MAG TPA: prepilin-type N-terminal cleavage/methylation domain-containing protein [Terriglobales bacterium]|nr:prepilin-type N-terminal cleavage/methylation domain-containing protein [Terriglobales bacterium]
MTSQINLSAKRESGFSLIEVMFSMVIMTVGLVSLLAVMGIAMASTQTSEQNAIAKRLANEAMESILTARETSQVQWAQIANGNCAVGQNCGIFLPGPQSINLPGADGIIGTSDDAAAGPQILEQPGSTGVYAGTCPPDTCYSLNNYTRTIAITPFALAGGGTDPNLNSITITVTFTTPQLRVPQNYVLQTLISQYR